MPPSTSPVVEGEAGEAYAYAPIQRAHRKEGEACALRLGCTLDRCSRCPLTRTCSLPESSPGRLWPPGMLCFRCFKGFRLMFQVFHLTLANRSGMLHMLQSNVSSVPGVSDVCFKCFIWIFHMLQWLYTHVSSVYFKRFTCFRLMLQVFHLNVAKVDLDVAYVAMTIYACFKRMFQVSHLVQMYIANVSSGRFKSRSGRAPVSSTAVALLLLLGVSSWVTVRVFKAGRGLRSTHSQAG
jgi:hypothetical protein